jgi:IS4 transposase
MRVVTVRCRTRNGKETVVRLATDLVDLPAEIIALIYRYRWQIELFFRWLKCTLGFRHLLAESPNGVRLQVYAALIATMLIVLWTGRKPTKRIFEAVGLWLQGWATDDELIEILDLSKNET